jgi:hypothetical protein
MNSNGKVDITVHTNPFVGAAGYRVAPTNRPIYRGRLITPTTPYKWICSGSSFREPFVRALLE